MDLPRLRLWLQQRAKGAQHPTLLVKADAGVTEHQLAEIVTAAHQAGFNVVEAADNAPADAAKHLGGSVKRVIISTASGDADATFVVGVNDDDFDPDRRQRDHGGCRRTQARHLRFRSRHPAQPQS